MSSLESIDSTHASSTSAPSRTRPRASRSDRQLAADGRRGHPDAARCCSRCWKRMRCRPSAPKRWPVRLRPASARSCCGSARSTSPRPPAHGPSLSGNQSEGLRKMLLAMVTDPRLVLIKLAAQLAQAAREPGRAGSRAPAARATRRGRSTRRSRTASASGSSSGSSRTGVPLPRARQLPAHRRLLAAKRGDRERYIEDVSRRCAPSWRKAQIDAEIAGRPKHIYSIWRKMQRKDLTFEQVFDVRAVRILVATIADCYAALGVVHGLWHVHPGRVRRLHRDAEGQRLPLAAHRGDRPAASCRWRCRSARARCTSTPSSASPRTGATRKAAAPIRPTSRRSSGCASCSSPASARKATATSSSACARNCSRIASTR